MGIDLIIALLLVAAVYIGYQRGLILAIFSFVAIWLGIFLAFKFTSQVAGWLGELVSVSDIWVPILVFLLILIGVILLVRLGAKSLEGVLEVAQLGIFNRLAGSLLYVLLLLMVASVLFQGLQWAHVITAADQRDSFFLKNVQPFFVEGFQSVGRWLPGGGDVLEKLEQYFRSAS
ncbi:MAG: CvpA family protein [Bacteroidota bacterium]